MGVVTIITGIVALLIGFLIARILLKNGIQDHEQIAKEKAEKIIKESESQAELLKKNKLLEAKEKFLQLKSEHEQDIQQKNTLASQRENSLKQKEQSLSQKLENSTRKEQELDTTRQNLNRQIEILDKKKSEVDQLHNQQVTQLKTLWKMRK
jgi:ribonuclease Y